MIPSSAWVGALVGLVLGILNSLAIRHLMMRLRSDSETDSLKIALLFVGKMALLFGGVWLLLTYANLHVLGFGLGFAAWTLFSAFLFQWLEAKGGAKNGP